MNVNHIKGNEKVFMDSKNKKPQSLFIYSIFCLYFVH